MRARWSIRMAATVVVSTALVLVAGVGVYGEGNPPTVECGPEMVGFNKFEFNDEDVAVNETMAPTEWSDPPGDIVTLTKTAALNYTYSVGPLPDGWVLAGIVVKGGNDPSSTAAPTGSLVVPENISHLTFCFEAASLSDDDPTGTTDDTTGTTDDTTGTTDDTTQTTHSTTNSATSNSTSSTTNDADEDAEVLGESLFRTDALARTGVTSLVISAAACVALTGGAQMRAASSRLARRRARRR